jgi:hypothetical protein
MLIYQKVKQNPNDGRQKQDAPGIVQELRVQAAQHGARILPLEDNGQKDIYQNLNARSL